MTTPAFPTIRNFRDCGGLAARGGVLKRGRLYRSAQFFQPSEADLAGVAALGIETIVDLRRPLEREKSPSMRWPGFSGRVIEHHGIDGIELPPHLSAMVGAGDSVESARAAMLEIYRGFPFDPLIVSLYRDFFSVLAESDGAVLVHCAAGKDRTGLVVALVHHIVGVSQGDILAHYLETNRHYVFADEMLEMVRQNFALDGRPYTLDAVRTVLQVIPEYLEAAFDVIGDKDAYLAETLGVTPERREKILARLTS